MSYKTPPGKGVRRIKPNKPIINWEDGRNELSQALQCEYIISILNDESLYNTKLIMHNYSKVYNMVVQSPPNNYGYHLYDYFIVNKSNEVLNFVNSFINDHLDKHNIDIQNSFKLCVKWNLYRKITDFFRKNLLYLDQFYTRKNKLPTIIERLYNTFLNHYSVSESDIELYEEEWKQVFKVQQRIHLSKIISYDIPYDLYETISQFASEKKITRKLLFKSIKIEIDDDESRSKNDTIFKLLD